MAEPARVLRAFGGLLSRRRRLTLGAPAVGVAAACGNILMFPAQYTSTALLLPRAPATSCTRPDTVCEIRIVTSGAFLGPAGQKTTPRRSARDVKDGIDVSAPADRVTRIDAHRSTGVQAQELSELIAESYVSFRRSSTGSSIEQNLRDRQASLQDQITALQAELEATTARAHALNIIAVCFQNGANAGLCALGAADRRLRAQLTVSMAYLIVGTTGAVLGGAPGTLWGVLTANLVGVLVR